MPSANNEAAAPTAAPLRSVAPGPTMADGLSVFRTRQDVVARLWLLLGRAVRRASLAVLFALGLASSASALSPPPDPRWIDVMRDAVVTEPIFRWSSCGMGGTMPCETFSTPEAAYEFIKAHRNVAPGCGSIVWTPFGGFGPAVDGRFSIEWYGTVTWTAECGSWTFRETSGLVKYCLVGFTPMAWMDPDGTELNFVCVKPAPVRTRCDTACEAQSTTFGNPISLADRTKRQVESDLRPVSAKGLRFERFYRSDQTGMRLSYAREAFSVQPTKKPPRCIQGWFFNGELNERQIGCARLFSMWEEGFVYRNEEGDHLQFWPASGGGVTAGVDVSHQIVSVGADGSMLLRTPANELEAYSPGGVLMARSFADGQGFTMEYSGAGTPTTVAPGPGMLTRVTDSFGRSLQLRYNASGGLASMMDPAGQIYSYTTDGAGNVARVDYPDSTSRTYLYNEPAYATATNMPDALTGIVDELGVRLSTFTYAIDGSVRSTEHAGGVQKFELGPDRVTLPGGETRIYAMASFGSFKAPAQVTRTCPTCTEARASFALDASGNTQSWDDFSGSRVCYGRLVARRLEEVRVEGLQGADTCSTLVSAGAVLPAGARKITSAWHPDWRLQTKRAEPGRIVTSVYNGQPDPFAGNAIASCAPASALLPDGKPIAVLCKQVEQASNDSNGSLGFSASLQAGVAARVQTWTYNPFGQMLTAKDPLNNTTTYAYHLATTADVTMGDLATVTNARGHVTQFTKYNKHGQLLQSIDPNGVPSVNTYDLRQRLTSRTVGGQGTSYAYDAAGQLTRVTRADASWIGYEYDAAHRMTAVFDNLGNRLEYTLDNAGNRTAENAKDPSGALRRTLSRSMDALGRVQLLTGKEPS